MIATDQGKNPRTSSEPANVRIRVGRNEKDPVFQGEDGYTKDINRNQEANSEILRVSATDEDTSVSILGFDLLLAHDSPRFQIQYL